MLCKAIQDPDPDAPPSSTWLPPHNPRQLLKLQLLPPHFSQQDGERTKEYVQKSHRTLQLTCRWPELCLMATSTAKKTGSENFFPDSSTPSHKLELLLLKGKWRIEIGKKIRGFCYKYKQTGF